MFYREQHQVTYYEDYVAGDAGSLRLDKITRDGETTWRISVSCSAAVTEHMPTDGLGVVELDTFAMRDLAESLIIEADKLETN